MFLRRLIVHASLFTVFFLFPSGASAQGIITTLAGNGRIFRGNGGPAGTAALGSLYGAAFDRAGNFYTSDLDNNLVLKISTSGVITVVAGNNIAGFSGDGGLATNASLDIPRGLVADSSGNLYIADDFNCRVRKVSPDGTINTFAGNGRCAFAGDGGPASNASLGGASGLALDAAGNLYIADNGNNRIRKVSTSGIITTAAGNGTASFSGDGGPATAASLNFPEGITFDTAGNLYIADNINNRVRKVSTTGIITTVAGDGSLTTGGDTGPATKAGVISPVGVLVDGDGYLYISSNVYIRIVFPDGTIYTLAGNGDAGFAGDAGQSFNAALNFPSDMALDSSGDLYLADTANARIRKIDLDVNISTIAGIGLTNYSGDGGAAPTSSLSAPLGVATDSAGNVYIADLENHRLRRVARDGTIATVAGTGIGGLTGDGGPATAAQLNEPSGVAVDAAGNLYIADFRNSRVRKINPAGVITTLAGTGVRGFTGDSGPAASARIYSPNDLAVDSAGNLYIADTSNQRIRKVTPNGTISTFAGSGAAGIGLGGFSGDGGPATSAVLNSPVGVAVDSVGNVYIADTGNSRIRKVGTDGIVRTVAGGGTVLPSNGSQATSVRLFGPGRVAVDLSGNFYISDTGSSTILKVTSAGTVTVVAGIFANDSYSGDGGPATRATLQFPEGIALDVAGNLFIADTSNDRVREVLAAAPSFAVAPATLTFTAAAGAVNIASQQITVTSSVAGLPWTAKVVTASGGSWLSLSTLSGSTPGSVSVLVDATNLAAGTYRGTVTFTAPAASPSTQTVAVTFTLTQANPAKLLVEPGTLSFALKNNASSSTASVKISNVGGGTLNFTAATTTNSGGGWLSVTPSNGAVTQSAPVSLTVTANPANLNAGTFTGQVAIVSSTTGERSNIPVTMTVSAAPQSMQLLQSGLTFTAVANGGSVPLQTFGVSNIGQGVMSWSASASTLSGGGWLSVSPGNGASDAGASQVPQAQVSVSPGGLAAGSYYGQVQVTSGSADNAPQTVTVALNVLPAGTNPGPVVRPTGLVFTGVAGGTSPGSQTVSIGNLTGTPTSFASGKLTYDGANWFTNAPASDTVSPSQASRIVVQPDITGLTPGVRRGALTLLFADGTVQSVNLLLVLTGSGAFPAAAGAAQNDCTPKDLFPIFTSLSNNFTAPTGWPTPLEVRVVDNCNNLMTTGSVRATFSNGDPFVSLSPSGQGFWSGTWQARSSTSAPVTVTITVDIPGQNLHGTTQVTGGLGAGQHPPVVGAGAVVSAAAFIPQSPVAPGTIISIFGTDLGSLGAADKLPLDTQLSGTRVIIGGQAMPLLYTSTGQINAVIPYGMALNSRSQVIVQRGNTVSVPEPVTIAASQPAVFTVDQSGKGQGVILLSDGITLADNSHPAGAGDVVVIYASGLGAVDPPLTAGSAASGSPLSNTVNLVTVTIGGADAQVQFAGLAPGFAGLYQVNAIVPGGVASGSQVPVTLSVAGQTSPTVTMTVQ